jgi:hypothetical protein
VVELGLDPLVDVAPYRAAERLGDHAVEQEQAAELAGRLARRPLAAVEHLGDRLVGAAVARQDHPAGIRSLLRVPGTLGDEPREHRLDEVVGVERLAGAGGEVGRRAALGQDADQVALGAGHLLLDAVDALVVGLGAGVAGRVAVQVQQDVDVRRAGRRGGQDDDRPAREVAALQAVERDPTQACGLALARVRHAGLLPADLPGEHRRERPIAGGARIGDGRGRRLRGDGGLRTAMPVVRVAGHLPTLRSGGGPA